MTYKSKRSQACSIPAKVKARVWERDGGCCVLCGSRNAAPNAHYISRAHGGLGIEENIFTACQRCHDAYDNGAKRKDIREVIRAYFLLRYPEWKEENLIYRKGE